MTKYEQAIKYYEEQLKVLDDHCKRGGEFAAEALEHTKTAIEALKKQVPRAQLDGVCTKCGSYTHSDNYCGVCGQVLNHEISKCISKNCFSCHEYSSNGPVCHHYADKGDEIRRLHEEG